MKNGIHPSYNQAVEVNCICGNSFTINTTAKGPIKVETCPACHPVYNKGVVKTQITKGRLEKFEEKKRKMEAAKSSSKKSS
ncbi:MAG TPA: 50S ribosomal protein L31 [Candidatus Absconditabacterales bacterium]|nr:50S ribosomal protein L31 [Candidatus Absconditabacterales bacterium]